MYLANSIVICIDKYNQTNVIPCSDQNAIVRTSSPQTNMYNTLTNVTTNSSVMNDTAIYNKGLALLMLYNYTGAIKYFDKALAINPKDVNALTGKGLALDDQGNHTGAIEYYDKALAIGIDPHDVRALTSKGLATY